MWAKSTPKHSMSIRHLQFWNFCLHFWIFHKMKVFIFDIFHKSNSDHCQAKSNRHLIVWEKQHQKTVSGIGRHSWTSIEIQTCPDEWHPLHDATKQWQITFSIWCLKKHGNICWSFPTTKNLLQSWVGEHRHLVNCIACFKQWAKHHNWICETKVIVGKIGFDQKWHSQMTAVSKEVICAAGHHMLWCVLGPSCVSQSRCHFVIPLMCFSQFLKDCQWLRLANQFSNLPASSQLCQRWWQRNFWQTFHPLISVNRRLGQLTDSRTHPQTDQPTVQRTNIPIDHQPNCATNNQTNPQSFLLTIWPPIRPPIQQSTNHQPNLIDQKCPWMRDQQSDWPSSHGSDQQSEKPTKKLTDRPTDKPTDKPTKKLTNQSTNKQTDKLRDKQQGWSVAKLVSPSQGQSDSWIVSPMQGRSVCCNVGQQQSRSVDGLVSWSVHRSVSQSFGQSAGANRQTNNSTDQLTLQPTDWFIVCRPILWWSAGLLVGWLHCWSVDCKVGPLPSWLVRCKVSQTVGLSVSCKVRMPQHKVSCSDVSLTKWETHNHHNANAVNGITDCLGLQNITHCVILCVQSNTKLSRTQAPKWSAGARWAESHLPMNDGTFFAGLHNELNATLSIACFVPTVISSGKCPTLWSSFARTSLDIVVLLFFCCIQNQWWVGVFNVCKWKWNGCQTTWVSMVFLWATQNCAVQIWHCHFLEMTWISVVNIVDIALIVPMPSFSFTLKFASTETRNRLALR